MLNQAVEGKFFVRVQNGLRDRRGVFASGSQDAVSWFSPSIVNMTGSQLLPASEGLPQKARRLALRLFVVLGLVAAITFVFFQLIPVNATTAGFFYLVAILMVATAWGLVEAAIASFFTYSLP